MILSFDELNPSFGSTPFNDGTFWRSQPTYLFSQATNVTLTAAATASVISTVGERGSPILPAGLLNVPGRTLVVTICGYASTGATAGTISLLFKLGSTIVATTAAVVPVVSQTTLGFMISALMTCKAANVAGGTGKIDTFGQWSLGALNTAVGGLAPIVNGSVSQTIAPATPAAVDQTTALLFDAQLTLSNALHSFTFTNVNIESAF